MAPTILAPASNVVRCSGVSFDHLRLAPARFRAYTSAASAASWLSGANSFGSRIHPSRSSVAVASAPLVSTADELVALAKKLRIADIAIGQPFFGSALSALGGGLRIDIWSAACASSFCISAYRSAAGVVGLEGGTFKDSGLFAAWDIVGDR